MGEVELEISEVFNLPELGKLFKALSDAFGITIGMTDLKYNPVIEPAGQSEFCKTVLDIPAGKKLCMKCASLGGLEAMRTNKPFVSHCHAGVYFGCVPVLIQGRYMGIICFGQVVLKDITEEDRSKLINGQSSLLNSIEDEALKHRLHELFMKLPQLEEERLLSIGTAIMCIINYMIEGITALKTSNRSYEWVFRNALTPLLEDSSNPLRPIGESRVKNSFPVPEDHQLYPALAYVEAHPERSITMHDMADLCKLSHSYFSKIFVRDIGVSFTDYVVSKKVGLARKKLRESSESIADIAASLGFTDTSYFIKVFKKVEGTTPLAYRQLRYLK